MAGVNSYDKIEKRIDRYMTIAAWMWGFVAFVNVVTLVLVALSHLIN